jgi:Glycosyl hydrolase family 26
VHGNLSLHDASRAIIRATVAGLLLLLASHHEGVGSSTPLLLGAALPGGPNSTENIGEFERQSGRHLDILELPMPWANANGFLSFGVSLPWVQAVAQHGSLPMITWEPEVGPSDTGTGAGPLYGACPAELATADRASPVFQYLEQFAKDVAAYGKPVLLRPMHEMNIPGWYWSIGPSDRCGLIHSKDYIAAWRRIVEIFRANGAHNVKFVWCINHITLNDATFTSTFPGDEYIDYAAIDGYNWGGERWTSFGGIFAPAYQALVGVSKRPILIAEWASAEAGGDKAAWISDAFVELKAGRFPRIVGLVWFDRANRGQPNWPIDSSPTAAAGYRAAVEGFASP